MRKTSAIASFALLVFIIPSFLIHAQAAEEKGSTTQPVKKLELSDVKDLNVDGLTKEQESLVLEMLNENSMKYCMSKSLADFLMDDPAHDIANKLAQDIVTKIKEGKSEKEIRFFVKTALRGARVLPDIDVNTVYDIAIAGSPFRGAENAAVTIVEFSDFQCPYCAGLSKILNEVAERNAAHVKHVFKNFPLSFHQFARLAAKAALAAGEQGKFWEMRQKLFDNYKTISKENISKFASEIGLDVEKFEKALENSAYDKLIDEDTIDGVLADVGGTPTVYINGKRYQGKRSAEGFEAEIRTITGTPAPSQPPAKDVPPSQ